MIWRNPWAWVGLVTVALPVLIHLLSRGHARVQRFPTLRFLEASRLLPTRRTRLHDLLLLVVRAAVFAAAVAALAQPVLRTANRTRALGRTLSRAIILDTSASMERATPTGGRALDSARGAARRLSGEAQGSTVIETRSPSRAIGAAVEWLNRQEGRGELVVLSDFQSGTLSALDLEGVPHAVGLRLVRLPVRDIAAPIEIIAHSSDGETVARTTLAPEGTSVEWSSRPAAARQADERVSVLSGPGEHAAADAALRAAATFAVRLPLDSAHAIAIVDPQFDQRASLLGSATTPRSRWTTDVVAHLRSDSMLIVASASAATAAVGVADTAGGLIVARTAAGRPVVIAKQDSIQGRERLLLFSFANAGSLTSAALIAATNAARSTAPPLAELDPSTVSDAALSSWQRPPAAEAPNRTSGSTNDGPSDGRWFWVAALLFLGLETWLRRALPPRSTQELARADRDRAA